MRKKILLSILILLIGVVVAGCSEEKMDVSSGWEIIMTDSKQTLDNDLKKVFEDAKKTSEEKLDYIALLAKQVVAGTNYMFLCKDNDSYKVVVIYRNLEGVSKITKVTDFNPIGYINENKEVVYEQLAGGWYVSIPDGNITIDSTVNNYFNKATKTLTGAAYYPIAVLAEQKKSGTDYALLCYGEGSYSGSMAGIYMLTLHIDKDDNPEIASISALDLADFNQ